MKNRRVLVLVSFMAFGLGNLTYAEGPERGYFGQAYDAVTGAVASGWQWVAGHAEPGEPGEAPIAEAIRAPKEEPVVSAIEMRSVFRSNLFDMYVLPELPRLNDDDPAGTTSRLLAEWAAVRDKEIKLNAARIRGEMPKLTATALAIRLLNKSLDAWKMLLHYLYETDVTLNDHVAYKDPLVEELQGLALVLKQLAATNFMAMPLAEVKLASFMSMTKALLADLMRKMSFIVEKYSSTEQDTALLAQKNQEVIHNLLAQIKSTAFAKRLTDDLDQAWRNVSETGYRF